MFHSVSLNEIKIEPFSKPSFLVQNILKNMAASIMFEKQKPESKSEEPRSRRNACYNSLCLQNQNSISGPKQNSDGFKKLWYSYAF